MYSPLVLYSGMNVRLRYFVRVTITRSYNTVVKEADFAVQNFAQVREALLYAFLGCSLCLNDVT